MTTLAPIYDKEWYDIYTWYDEFWFNREWYDRSWYNKYWVNKEGEPYEYVHLNKRHKQYLWNISDKTEEDRKRIDDINIIFSDRHQGYICPICKFGISHENLCYCKCKKKNSN